ncbi:MAG: hypothetical protein DYG98_21855 [Haliscomenobacteraceae bacterium CHB4]|nr:hypothetical protein [Haliscomenobacteraceae bacterium CHB4]
MPPLENIQSELKSAIASGELGEALRLFTQRVAPSSAVLNQIILQLRRFHTIEKEYKAGLVLPAERNTECSRIAHAVLAMIDALAETDVANTAGESPERPAFGLPVAAYSPLQTLLANLRIDWKNTPISDLHLVNCNRIAEFRMLKRTLRDRSAGGEEFQFYFINACPMQRPESFAERVILEIIHSLDDEDAEAVLIRRKPNGNRIKIEELPFDFMGLEQSKKKFARYFADRFGFHERIEPIEDFLRACVHKMRDYRYVGFVFSIDANTDWEPFFPDYLQWMMDTFSGIHEEGPIYLFFFPVLARNLHETPSPTLQEVAQAICHLGEAKNAVSSVISPLPPVVKEEVQDWFVEFGEADASKIDDLILLTLQREKSAALRIGRFLQQGKVDMYDVEALQAEVYRYAQH